MTSDSPTSDLGSGASELGRRRLKAIMFTDIKGYSAMMGADEALTVKLVLEHRQIVRDCLKIHDGEEHETIGDAFVVLFDSVINAVRCAAQIQQILATRNAGLPVAEQVVLRIGVHLGDIIVQGDGIYGDGVNVAARVQDKADPGGISITEPVFLQIDGKIDYPFEKMGKIELKNIRHPPSIYKVHLDGKPIAPKRRNPAPLIIASLAGLVLLSVGAWFAMQPAAAPASAPFVSATAPSTQAEAAKPAAMPALPTAQLPIVLADSRKQQAGRKVAEAMSAVGQARLELLRQALALDPDNSSVQNMLASTMAANLPAAASASAPVPANQATGDHAPAAKPLHVKIKSAGSNADDGSTKIKRSIVVE